MGVGAVEPFVIAREGTFDIRAAQEVARALAGVPHFEVCLDLSQVREFHDFGLAVLARALARRSPLVRVLGLNQHHARLLRYLGVEAVGRDEPGDALADGRS
ncbi:MAG TPA: STAS domain-containing protein [Anaeromyxobacteraceae bacterium]|nr:STAS domain-containing protein [Anaeromyxobacteraceae bacterium]